MRSNSSRGKILLVEDDISIREILAETLEELDYEITQANDGMEAIDILREQSSGWLALITDIQMPKVDGLELIISLHEIGLRFPAIIITSSIHISNDKINRLIAEGKVCSIKKPYEIETITKILERVLK
jgi:DNA-binding NtrC family response regulator